MTWYRQDHRGPIAKLLPDDPLHRHKRPMDFYLETKSVLKSSPALYPFTEKSASLFLGTLHLFFQIKLAFTDLFNECVNQGVGKPAGGMRSASFFTPPLGILSVTQCLGVLGKVFPERFFKTIPIVME